MIKRCFILYMFHLLLISCKPDYDVMFPEEIPLGSILIYVDGELGDYENFSVLHKTLDSLGRLRISFAETKDLFIHQLVSTTYFPNENTEYTVSDEIKKEPHYMITYFNQIYDEDSDGWEYKYCGTEEDYFKIEKFDTLNQIISGNGKLRFKRVKKHGAPGGAGIDKIIYIDLAFHDFYEVK